MMTQGNDDESGELEVVQLSEQQTRSQIQLYRSLAGQGTRGELCI